MLSVFSPHLHKSWKIRSNCISSHLCCMYRRNGAAQRKIQENSISDKSVNHKYANYLLSNIIYNSRIVYPILHFSCFCNLLHRICLRLFAWQKLVGVISPTEKYRMYPKLFVPVILLAKFQCQANHIFSEVIKS